MNLTLHSEPEDDLARRLSRALETARDIPIPAGFAQRVAARAAELPVPAVKSPDRRTSFVSHAIRFALVAQILIMFALAPWAAAHRASTLPALAECLFALEFVLLTVWLSLSPLLEPA